ncbi:MAG: DUF177 domain-containing protein [Thermoleophilia bacterium]|nr:DUF177 domain-containing protein [Thermoleophilia bacterium]
MTTTIALRDLKMVAGEGRSVELATDLAPWSQGGFAYATVGDRKVNARIYVSAMDGAGWAFHLRFDTVVHGPCARCLEDARVALRIDTHEVHDPTQKDDEDLYSFFVDRDEVLDVSEWAFDAVGIEFPTKVLCRDDCKGLCPSCGINRNEDTCSCDLSNPDPRWEKLRELKLAAEDQVAADDAHAADS